jgi:3-methyladenine DNA glycosylase AlkC
MAAALKELYSHKYIELLANSLQKEFNDFNVKEFQEKVFDTSWQDKALKSRMTHIATALHSCLPQNFPQSIEMLKASFGSMNYAFSLENMVFQEYVRLYGLDDFETSMQALAAFTINSSSEFAIRFFLIRYEKETLIQMKKWASSKNEHLRRLASEGSRPRLPWAIALDSFKKDPSPIVEILELLKDDASIYVRKSVANSLNDISKDNPHITKEIAQSWINHSKERDKLLKHGCRTLLKRGDKEMLLLFNVAEATHIKIENFRLAKEVKMGEELAFSFELQSRENLGYLRLEYSISFLRKNGSHNSKVFKIAESQYDYPQRLFSKSYSFKPITTRSYYSGRHELCIILNGVVVQNAEFTLI